MSFHLPHKGFVALDEDAPDAPDPLVFTAGEGAPEFSATAIGTPMPTWRFEGGEEVTWRKPTHDWGAGPRTAEILNPWGLTYLELMSCGLTGTLDTADITSKVSWLSPAKLQTLDLSGNDLTGGLATLDLPDSLTHLYLNGNDLSGNVVGAPFPTGIALIHLADNGLSQAELESIINAIYLGRMGFTYPSPVLHIEGNAALSSPGLFGVSLLENDPSDEGFVTWTIHHS